VHFTEKGEGLECLEPLFGRVADGTFFQSFAINSVTADLADVDWVQL
jgi:hypothetical protein